MSRQMFSDEEMAARSRIYSKSQSLAKTYVARKHKAEYDEAYAKIRDRLLADEGLVSVQAMGSRRKVDDWSEYGLE